MKPSPYAWLLTSISAAGKLFQCPGRSGASGLLLLPGKAPLSCQGCDGPSITSGHGWACPPGGCGWEAQRDFSGEARMPLESRSTRPAQEAPAQPWNEGDPNLCRLCQDSAQLREELGGTLARVRAEEASPVFLKLCFPRALCCAGWPSRGETGEKVCVGRRPGRRGAVRAVALAGLGCPPASWAAGTRPR